jgi:RNA polymerase sigma-70 factor, ECF subfamily
MDKHSMAAVLPVAAGSEPAGRLAALFEVHYERLYRLARRLSPSGDEARDLVQETFLKAARFPKSIPVGASNEEAWLVRVLINIRRDQWRKAAVRDRHRKAAFGGGHSGMGSRNPEGGLIARRAVWQALNILSPRRRAVVVMYELEELAIPKIASLLGISAITVRWHLSMGRRDLARALKPSFGGTHEQS